MPDWNFTRLLLSCTAIFLIAGPCRADTFEQRRQACFDAILQDYNAHPTKLSGHMAFFQAEAMFEMGKVEEGRRLVGRGLDQLVPGNRENRWIHGGNSGFTAWPGIDCYIRYQKFLDEPLRERYRKIYCGAVFYRRLSTSNHKIMASVTRYLATQAWGPDAFHPDPFFEGKEDSGAYFEKNDPTGEKYIRQVIADTFSSGPGEYASRPYGGSNLLPLLSVADCASDPALKKQAQTAYEYCLVEFAPVWLRGHLATFAPRSYPDVETQRPWGVAAVAWAYFGGIAPSELQNQQLIAAMTSPYRLPEIIEKIADDRSQPYVHRALIDKWALYHFVNKSYILFSRSPKATGGGFMGQSYPCGVMWEQPDVSRGSHLWVTNPAADENGVEGNKPTGIHTHGVTQHEQELQHRDALLFVFNIPAGFRNPYALGYIPGGYEAMRSDDTHLFLHYGSVLIAVTSSHPIQYDPKAGIRAPAGAPRAGDTEFRVRALQCAIAIETALPAEFPAGTASHQLDAFRERMLAKGKIELTPSDKPTGRYTDRNVNQLDCTFGGPDLINGAEVNYANWPVLEDPWMKQQKPGAPLTITFGKETLTLKEQ